MIGYVFGLKGVARGTPGEEMLLWLCTGSLNRIKNDLSGSNYGSWFLGVDLEIGFRIFVLF